MNMNINDNEKLLFADEQRDLLVTSERVCTSDEIFRISEIQRVEIKDHQRPRTEEIINMITLLLCILGLAFFIYSGEKNSLALIICVISGIIWLISVDGGGGLFLVLIGHGKNGSIEICRVYYWYKIGVFKSQINNEIEEDKKALNSLKDAIGQAMSMR